MGGSVTHLATQATIILLNRQNANHMTKSINRVISKYLRQELPTPKQILKMSSRQGSGPVKAELDPSYGSLNVIGFIKLEDLPGMKT